MSLVFGQDTLCKHGVVGPCRECDPYAVARRSDPETSHAAARSIPSEHIRRSQEWVLHILKEFGPMTDQRLVELTLGDMSESGARTRRSELVRLGKVVDTGRTETLPSGRAAKVWKAAE